MRLPLIVALVVAGGCARGGQSALPGGDDDSHTDAATNGTHDAPMSQTGDDAAVMPDAAMPDAPPPPAGDTLLLTEVVLAPTEGEFIEIANPTSAAVNLSTYYLTDSGNYFRVPAGATVDGSDFIAKFPAGASIAAHGVITVAIDTTANFTATYGMAPTYSLASGTMTTVVVSGTPTLTNAGELVALFQWDGQADLVKDVDLVLAGVPSVANALVDKSAVALDGPDSGATTSAYKADTRTMLSQAMTPGSAKSTKRMLPEAGHETQSGGGNGITGDDETSEDTAATWDSSGFTNPTPGTVPATVVP